MLLLVYLLCDYLVSLVVYVFCLNYRTRTEVLVDEEMSAIDAEQEQEDQIMQAQIEEYEKWHGQNMIL